MRQLGDLAVWLGLIVLAVGVVYYTPVVAEYVTSEPRPNVKAAPRGGPRIHHTMVHPPHQFGEPGYSR